MLTVEGELTALIYTLYAIDCVHWLKPGHMAVTRRFAGGWKAHRFRDDSYTLLGRMPVFVNPIDFRPSYLSGPVDEMEQSEQLIPDQILQLAPDTRVLTVISWIGAINLLIFLPALLMTGYLAAWWRMPLSLALCTQVCTAFEVYEQSAGWRRARGSDFWQQLTSLLLNPLAALRSGDVLLKGLFGAGLHKVR
jgi:hypothetical protein